MKIPDSLFIKKGRPKKEEDEKKSTRFSLRLTAEEKKIIDFMAEKHKKSASEYLRWLVLQDVKRNRLVRSLKDDEKEH